MKSIIKLSISVIILVLVGCSTIPKFYPPMAPPQNFTWMYFPTVETWLLHPAEWHPHHGSKGNCQVVSISKENVKTKGSFEIGVTLQLIQNTQTINGFPPDVVAAKLVEAIQNNKVNSIIRSDDKMTDRDGAKSLRIRYRNDPDGFEPIIVHKFFIADMENQNLYVATFESPESSWESNWRDFGNQIMSQVIICDLIENQLK